MFPRLSGLARFTFVDVILWALRAGVVIVVVAGTIGTLLKGRYAAAQWFDLLIFGLTIGSVYALIALGYTMVYGVLRLINFAHGDIMMTGAFSGFVERRGDEESGKGARHHDDGRLFRILRRLGARRLRRAQQSPGTRDG